MNKLSGSATRTHKRVNKNKARNQRKEFTVEAKRKLYFRAVAKNACRIQHKQTMFVQCVGATNVGGDMRLYAVDLCSVQGTV